MDQVNTTIDWIVEYLEWSNAGERDFWPGAPAGSGIDAAGAGSSSEFSAAYLEWTDAAQAVIEPGFDLARREAALWAALRTESDCVHILRQLLEAGDAPPRSMKFAFEAIEDVAADVHALMGKVLELRVH
jgi:hypothetical protein